MRSWHGGCGIFAVMSGATTSSAPVDTGASPRSEPPRPQRLGGLDLLRILSIFHVVGFHLSRSGMRFDPAQLAGHVRASLQAFVLLSIVVMLAKGTPRALGPYAARRSRRILLPWLFWSAAYGVTIVVPPIVSGRPVLAVLDWKMLIYGTVPHLWFLPFILGVNLAIVALARATGRLRLGMLALLCGAAGFVVAWLTSFYASKLGLPERQWVGCLPAIPLGLLLARWSAERPPVTRSARWVLTALLLAAVGALLAFYDAWWFDTAFATAVCALAVVAPIPARPWLIWTSGLAFGVYTIHPILVSHVYWPLFHGNPWKCAPFVVVLSGLIAWLMRKSPLRSVA